MAFIKTFKKTPAVSGLIKMAKKQIIFCLGNKEELEAITGREYDYIRGIYLNYLAFGDDPRLPDNRKTSKDSDGFYVVSSVYNGMKPLKSKTKKETYLSSISDDGTESKAQELLYSHAEFIGADAIINYRFTLGMGPDKRWGLAMGTPVKLRRVLLR